MTIRIRIDATINVGTVRRVIDAKRVSLRAPLPRVFDAINHRGL